MKINKDYLVTDRNKHGGKRKQPVSVLIPHHNAGVASGENVAKYIKNTNRQLSATYIIGGGGEIYQGLDESLEPYTTSNRAIDTKAITFEIANSTGAPTWQITDKAFDALVELSIDICKRHGIKEVNYTGDKRGNIHLHEWYAQTNCPGPYLKGKMPEYTRRVNEGLQGKPVIPVEPTDKELYRVRKTWADAKTQLGAYQVLDNAIKKVKENRGYKVFNEKGVAIYDAVAPVKPKPVAKTDKQLAQEVIDGKHGNGDARKKSLGDRFSAVQVEVNKILYGTASTKPKRLTDKEVAYQIVFGKNIWGNGRERVRNLQRDGYNYEAVQREVNRLV